MISGQEIPIWVVALMGFIFAICVNFIWTRTRGFARVALVVIIVPILYISSAILVWGDIRRSALFAFFLLFPEYVIHLHKPLGRITVRTIKYFTVFAAYTWVLWWISWVHIDTVMFLSTNVSLNDVPIVSLLPVYFFVSTLKIRLVSLHCLYAC